MSKPTNPRLKRLIGQPERIVQAEESVVLEAGVITQFGRKEQSALEHDLAGKALAQLLVRARTDSGLTVRKMASLIGRHPSRIGAIEQGSSAMAFRTFVDYAQALGYRIEIRLTPTDPDREPLSTVLVREEPPR